MSEEGGRLTRRLPDRQASSFDVPSWLRGLGTGRLASCLMMGEKERAGLLTVTYSCSGRTVDVRIRRVGGMAAAAWELTADVDGKTERIVVPGATRFVWRS